jgi:cell wall-associated NlpC family hydrolase
MKYRGEQASKTLRNTAFGNCGSIFDSLGLLNHFNMRYIIFTFLSFIVFTAVHYSFQKDATSSPIKEGNGMVAHPVSHPETIIDEQESPIPAIIPPVKDESELQKHYLQSGQTVNADEFITYAKGLIGTPYIYGSTDPQKGFDCSGFINHISGHFGMKVPRSSIEFTNLGNEISTVNAKPGDIILFTGTDPQSRVVGHMGVVTDNPNGQLEFIHSSSGKAKGVVISPLKGYYESRFVKVIRFFPLTYSNPIA